MTPREARWFRRSSRTGLPVAEPERVQLRSRRLPIHLRAELEQLAAELDGVGPPAPSQLFRTARRAETLVGPLLHVGVGLDMLRFERERALKDAAASAVRAGFSPAQVARASGLGRQWLLNQRLQ